LLGDEHYGIGGEGEQLHNMDSSKGLCLQIASGEKAAVNPDTYSFLSLRGFDLFPLPSRILFFSTIHSLPILYLSIYEHTRRAFSNSL
jgi:hypothetical protein